MLRQNRLLALRYRRINFPNHRILERLHLSRNISSLCAIMVTPRIVLQVHFLVSPRIRITSLISIKTISRMRMSSVDTDSKDSTHPGNVEFRRLIQVYKPMYQGFDECAWNEDKVEKLHRRQKALWRSQSFHCYTRRWNALSSNGRMGKEQGEPGSSRDASSQNRRSKSR